MDWKDIAGKLITMGAPAIGTALGGPLGGTIGGVLGNIVASELGVEATPQAVADKINDPGADTEVIKAQLSSADAKGQQELDRFRAALEDVQDARKTEVALAQTGSRLAWAPVIMSVLATVGFFAFSYLSMAKPNGVDRDVVMYLLGVWSSAFMMAMSYWLGSSSGSADKSAQIAQLIPQTIPAKKLPLLGGRK